MFRFLFSVMLGLAAILPDAANAQDASFYQCQNDRIRISIAAMPLEKAIAGFTRATRCPVSLDVDAVKGRQTRTMRTARVAGRLTPEQALTRMLRTTPLKARMIHGGFSVNK